MTFDTNISARITRFGLMLVAMTALALGVLLTTPQPAAAQCGPERTVFNQDLEIKQGEEVPCDVTVTNGDLTIKGTVKGKVTVFNGNADIYGQVLGDVAVLNRGNVTLYPNSSVGGNIVASGDVALNDNSNVSGSVTSFGGDVNKDSKAVIKGEINKLSSAEGPRNPAQWFGGAFSNNSFNAFNPFHELGAMFGLGILSVVILLLAVGIAAIFPLRLRTTSATLETEPGPSIVVGIIAAFLIMPVAGITAFILAISVVGIVLLPVLAIVVLGAFLFGFVVVSHWLGKHLHATIRQDDALMPARTPAPAPNSLHHPPTLIIEVLLGAAIILGSTLLPSLFLHIWIAALMFVLLYSLVCIGLGAAVLSRFGTLSPPKHQRRPTIFYPTSAHNHYGQALSHTAQQQAIQPQEHNNTNTRPLGPTPVLTREE